MKTRKLKLLTALMPVLHAMNQAFGDVELPKDFEWNLDPQRANRLFLKPIFTTSNPLTSIFSVMRRVKVEAIMYYLGHPSKIIQRNDDCEFTPKGSMGMTQRKINVYRLKVEMQQCNDEFFDTCLEYALGDELDIFDPENPAHMKALKNAMLMHVQMAKINDLFKLAFFGDRTLVDDFYNTTDGVYKFIDEAVANGDIIEVGAGSGAALNAGDSITIFESLHAQSKIQLRKLGNNLKNYMVTESIYENYRKYLQALGTELANTYIINGVPKGLLYNGIPVIEIPEWDEVLTGDFGLTNPHRAIYSATGNLKVATDISGTESKFRVYRDPVHMKKWFYASAFTFGANYTHSELMTVAK